MFRANSLNLQAILVRRHSPLEQSFVEVTGESLGDDEVRCEQRITEMSRRSISC